MIVQNAEILSSNRIKPAGTRPPQIFVEKPKKKTVNAVLNKTIVQSF